MERLVVNKATWEVLVQPDADGSTTAAPVIRMAKEGEVVIRDAKGRLSVPVWHDRGWRYVGVQSIDEPLDPSHDGYGGS